MISKWTEKEIVSEKDYKIFTAMEVKKQNSKTEQMSNFVRLDSKDWVNIIPLTKENKIVLIKQYRHGNDEITVEIPGGMVDRNESPDIAATRECIEETGFSSKNKPILLGSDIPNPAFINNRHSSYLLTDCELTHETNFDEHEDIEVLEASKEEVENMIDEGIITHSLVLCAFYFYERYNKANGK